MRNTMPRLIDDQRKLTCKIVAAVMIAAAALGLFTYNAWMQPFRQRRAELRALADEGRSILARFDETFGSGGNDGLEARKEQMVRIANKSALADARGIPSLELDTDLYAEEDRPKAEEIINNHRKWNSEWNSATNDLEQARRTAELSVVKIDELLANPVSANADRARSDLDQSLEELRKLSDISRPAADTADAAKSRFNTAAERAASARSSAEIWISSSQAMRAYADKVFSKANEAVGRMKAAEDEDEKLRNAMKKLRIDPDSPRLKILKDKLATASNRVRTADQKLVKSLKDAESRRDKKTKAARKNFTETLAKIKAFENLYEPIAPRKDHATAESFERVVAVDAEAWTNSVERMTSLRNQAQQLLDDAERVVEEINAISGSGATTFDGSNATKFVGKLEASAKQLGAAAGKVSSAEPDPGIEETVAGIQALWIALQEAKPNLHELVEDVHAKATTTIGELVQLESKKSSHAKYISDGSGPAKAQLASQLSACTIPERVETDLSELESASASDGKSIADLQKRLEECMAKVDAYKTAVRQVEEKLRKAETDGIFVPLRWEEGVQGRNPNNRFADWIVSPGTVLVPQGSTSTRQYEWRFALDVTKAGEHKIEIKVEKSISEPVNEAIDPKKFVVQEGHRAKGGWIDVKCTLATGSLSWTDDLWTPNYQSFDPDLVLEATAKLASGRQSFSLNLELDTNPSSLPYQGWNIDRLQFRVFLDGQPVSKFWHKDQ